MVDLELCFDLGGQNEKVPGQEVSRT